MMTVNLDRNTAIEIFMSILISHTRDGVIQDMMSLLEKGPPGRQPLEDKVILSRWFQQLDPQGREYISRIIQEAVDRALFSTLVILDGAAGYPIQGVPSDFALYLQTYSDDNAEMSDLPQFRVKLNPKRAATEDLHDIFRWTIEEQSHDPDK